MPSDVRLLTFVVASLALIAIPGPNLIYIVTRSMSQGTRAGLVSAAGVETGTLVHVTAAALGLSSLVTASPLAFSALRYAGAAYLLYLGIQALRSRPGPAANGPDTASRLRRLYLDGAVVNVLNPKVGLFFIAFLPQFVERGEGGAAPAAQMLVLGAVFFALAFSLDIGYALVAGTVGNRLRRARTRTASAPKASRPFQGRHVTATVYLGLGAFAALSGGK